MDASAHNLPAARPSLTDSAWFWLMLFSCMSLLALQLMDWKYNERQARLERQFQGRQWAAEHGAHVEMNPAASLESRPRVPLSEAVISAEGQTAVSAQQRYSQPGRLLISLWPLRLLAGVGLCASLWMMRKQKQQTEGDAGQLKSESNSPTMVSSSLPPSSSNTTVPAERGVPFS